MTKPDHHGRDHRPGGEDPIPDVGGTPFATLRVGGTFTIPGDNVWHYLNLDSATSPPVVVWDTSSDAIFSNAASSFAGTPKGVGLAQPGSYDIYVNASATGGTAGAILEVYHDDQTPGSGFLSDFQFGRTSLLIGDTWDHDIDNHLSFWEREGFPTDADIPAVLVFKAKLHSGADIALSIQVLVDRVNPYGSNAF